MNVVVYCSSYEDLAAEYQESAVTLGEWIGKNGCRLVYGGVSAGLMRLCADKVRECGGGVTGIIPEVFKHRLSESVDTAIFTKNLNDRKDKMIELGDVYVVLPGGLGTIDEWISTMSIMKVAGETEPRIIVVNICGIFDNQIKQLEQTAHSPFAKDSMLQLMTVANTTEELVETLDRYKQKTF